ncbi:MAG: asparagine synthase (glutamine-hydrolyzing) [Chthoniobacter sp.]|nr:asparagine synthase (glutamine-hydrolyzing) [Chthoniobacter sp.]
MCGIAGFIAPGRSAEECGAHLDRMLASIVHRGPDGAGTHVLPGLALGMRRLSIIDLEGGGQPVWNEDHTIGIVFNGEIYNYVELTAQLTAAGHVFRTHSDTEVLVHLYEEVGVAMFAQLRGMFAFAIFDTRKNRLLIARDHFGQKPLYYSRAGGSFAFASELKALLTLPWISRDRDADALPDYVSWLSLPCPRTHFRHIHKLGAGHFLSLPLADFGTATPYRYWHYDLTAAPDLIELDAAVEALDTTLRDSVQMHLRADVPVGVLLSSGLDSRTVSAYAQELQPSGMQTFTVGFGGADSETLGAAETAREIGSRHHTLELTDRDLVESIERIAWHLDEPVGDPATFAVLKVCELARQHVKVLLSGEGSDELFGGYDARYLGMLSTIERSEKLRQLTPLLPSDDDGAAPSRWHRLLSRAHRERGSEALSLRLEGLPGDVRTPRGLTPDQLRRLRQRTDDLARCMVLPQRDTLSQLLTLDLDWQLAESLLQKADKMSMGASIELRTPLLDLRVAELAARIPSALKLPPGGPGKFVLRHCLARKLNEPLNRPKRGFPVPLRAWFTGPLRAALEDTLLSPNAACLDYLDRSLLRTAWNDFLSGAWDGARPLFALWLYEIWSAKMRSPC